MDSTVLVAVITGIFTLTTGYVGGSALKGRSEARKIDTQTNVLRTKLPVEVDSLAIQNADAALEMQRHINTTLIAELARKDVESARKDQEIAMLHGVIDQRDATLEGLRGDLSEAHRFGNQMLKALADADRRYADLVTQQSSAPNRPQQQ